MLEKNGAAGDVPNVLLVVLEGCGQVGEDVRGQQVDPTVDDTGHECLRLLHIVQHLAIASIIWFLLFVLSGPCKSPPSLKFSRNLSTQFLLFKYFK